MAKLAVVQLRLKGVASLLMHNERGVNPFDPLVKQIDALTSKRKNMTEEDKLLKYRLEWEVGLYYAPGIGPYIPGENLKKALFEAATAFRGGASVKRGVIPLDAEIPLIYHGPRDIDGMYEAGEGFQFVDIRSIGISRKRVMRARPMFKEWGLEASMQVDTSVLDMDDFRRYVAHAGRITGLGDYRPRFGRFVSEMDILEEIEISEGMNGEASDDADE